MLWRNIVSNRIDFKNMTFTHLYYRRCYDVTAIVSHLFYRPVGYLMQDGHFRSVFGQATVRYDGSVLTYAGKLIR